MYDLIRRLTQWLGLLFGPGTGSHRAGDPLPVPPGPPYLCLHLPVRRSPYCSHPPLDATESRLVRPYLVANERERARQRRRRVALVLAADFGIDLDAHVVGAQRAAA
ncbi:hypothetical protein [Streptomyces griseoaurantiacus]|uniref:hypothetical protein n=1 Tax=Streptomyces griseoaurantiacus TaxID=68213 RepID=UPI00378ED763